MFIWDRRLYEEIWYIFMLILTVFFVTCSPLMFALIVLLLEVVSETLCTLIIDNKSHKLVEKYFKVIVFFIK